MNYDCIIKSQETREGVRFRALKDGKYFFLTVNFQNYFYIKNVDFISYEEPFMKEFAFCIADIQKVGQFRKIILSNNFMRTKVRNFWETNCNTYEADIRANMRFLLDNKIELNNDKIPYTFYDIETDDRLPLQKDERGNVVPGNARILSFSGTNYKGEQVYFELNSDSDDDERALLFMIINYFSNYGIISGWNSEKFDMPYIKGRCDTLGVNYDILEYVNHLDYMDIFKKYDKKSRKSFSLNNISNEVLNESKIEQEKGDGKLYNTWLHDKEQLRKYNMEDSNLNYKINKKMMFIEVSMKRANRAQCNVRNTVNNSDSGDYLLMRKYKEHNVIMPSKPTREEAERRKAKGSIGGGYTTCFLPGLHENVFVWDFKSEYPSVIQTWNISPETYVETIYNEKDAALIDREKFIVTPADFEGTYHPARVYRKEEGIIPLVVRELVEARDLIKYPMAKYAEFLKDGTPNPDHNPEKYKQLYLEQYAIKTDGNSIYGILAFPLSRYYSWELGDSVTTCARATLKSCNEMLKQEGCTVIGGDTDSTFVLLNGHTEEEIDNKFIKHLEEWGKKFGAIHNKLVFEYEKTFDKMLFVKKKNYAYIMNGKITIKGLEAIKSDSNITAAKLQKDFIYDILQDKYDENAWRQKIELLYNKVFNQEMTTEELLLVKALTKMPKDYRGYIIDKKTKKPKIKKDGTLQEKAIPAHVKLAERLISQGKDIYPGSKMKYIVVKDGPILALSKEEYEKGSGVFEYKHKKFGIIDYEWDKEYEAKYYWKRIIRSVIKVVYVYYGNLPDWSWNITQGQLNKLITTPDDED